MLSDTIITHIFKFFGIPKTDGMFSVMSDNCKLKKELAVELDDGEKVAKNLWGVSGKISNSELKLLAVDAGVDQESKPVLVFQMDDLTVYVLVLSDKPKAFLWYSEKWVELSSLDLAKLLVGIEQLRELLIDWKKLDNYQNHYEHLVSFLNFEENVYS